jgi:genome maintenance exonuclease 1
VFQHRSLPVYELESYNEEGKRFYRTPSGKSYPSVTTVLSSLSKDGILQWRKRVGEEEANKVSTKSSRRGTALHKLCEDYVNNERFYAKGAMPYVVEMFRGIKKDIDENVSEVYGNEIPLYSDTLKTAGRSDMFCEYEGVPTIVDFKTSSKVKKEEWIESYFLQTTCYSMMIEEMYGLEVPNIAILIAVEGEKDIQKFVKKNAPYRDKVHDLFTNFKV